MNSKLLQNAIFGASDGLVGTVGVLGGLLLSSAPLNVLIATIAASAAANALSMSGGEFVSDEIADGNAWQRALIMGVFFFVAAGSPLLGYFVNRSVGNIVAFVVVLSLATGISLVRARRHGILKGFFQVYGVLLSATIAAVGAVLLVGVGGG